jgi:ubiquinol-cytochrome c reductase cytochrome b subunit
MRLVKKTPIVNILYDFFIYYPAPSNLSYFWNFGIYAFVSLIIQIITGIFLAMHYVADQNLAFLSVEHIMRDVQLGWLLRYIHANGASMFFLVVYIHIFRNFYYMSFINPRELLWSIGVVILLLMIITAFLGYVLPWGQMSFWAATVITNFVSAVPKIGNDLVIWLWGGYSVNNATLTRFYSLHYLLPFIIFLFVVLHLIFLHKTGSNNPLGIEFKFSDYVFMYPYYIVKDLFGVICFFIFFSIFIFFFPNFLGHTDNYIPANSMVTPTHIVPEWYFLPFYTILRSIPNKLFGVLLMLFSVLILFFIPFLLKINVKSSDFKPLNRLFFWFFFFICLLLGWLGGKPAEYPFVIVGQKITFSYFFFLIFLYPLINKIEIFFWYK